MTTSEKEPLPILDTFGDAAISKCEQDLAETKQKAIDAVSGRNPKKWRHAYFNKKAKELEASLTFTKCLISEYREARKNGHYTWNDADLEQIQKLAHALKSKETRGFEKRTALETCHKIMADNEQSINSWRHPFGQQSSIAPYGEIVIAQLTRENAGRLEALRLFKQEREAA